MVKVVRKPPREKVIVNFSQVIHEQSRTREIVARSRQQLFHDLALHIRQTEVAALETVGELRVIEAEQVQQRRVQVVDVDFVFRGVEAEVVGLAEREAGLYAAAREP